MQGLCAGPSTQLPKGAAGSMSHATHSLPSCPFRQQRTHSSRRGHQRATVVAQAVGNPAQSDPLGQLKDGVSIRRRPPLGRENQPCGSLQMRVTGMPEENKPRNILEEIVWFKTSEVDFMRERQPLLALQAVAKAAPAARNFKEALQKKAQETGKPGLIAEVKKASPSKGVIQPDFDPVRIAKAYEAGGAACLSVLTDERYFQGSFQNLLDIRAAGVACPLLCKEFIVEAYQVYKARASGADAILLIAAVLPNQDLLYFSKAAALLGMQCLIEVHTEDELARVLEVPGIENHLLGINNRDLGTFKVDLGLTEKLMSSPPGQKAKERGIMVTAESGIFTPGDVEVVQKAGTSAILVGESLVKQGDPTAGVRELLSLAPK